VTTIQAHGIAAALPNGFEGRIFQRNPSDGSIARPVAHFATFALPANIADFGTGAVTLMGPSDVFVVLFEYGPESVGKALFARQGMPQALGASDFSPITLRVGVQGQVGTQWFFVESGRPFTLYAVLGSQAMTGVLLPQVNALLRGINVAQIAATP
jgi:hypothetical protein